MTHWFVWHLGAELLGLPFPHEESFWSTKRGGGGVPCFLLLTHTYTLCVAKSVGTSMAYCQTKAFRRSVVQDVPQYSIKIFVASTSVQSCTAFVKRSITSGYMRTQG